MAEDVKDIQDGEVSEETTSKATVVAPQPLTREELLNEMKSLRSELSREFQSTKDKAVSESRREMDRRIRDLEAENQALSQGLAGYNPETGVDPKTYLELQTLRKRDQLRQQQEQEQVRTNAIQKTRDTFKLGLVKHAESVGVDPKTIDWGELDGEEIPDFATHQIRILDQIGVGVKGKLSEFDKRLKELEHKPEEEEDVVNSVDTSVDTSKTVSSVIPMRMSEFTAWVEELSSEEYKRLRPKIDQMLNEGKIK